MRNDILMKDFHILYHTNCPIKKSTKDNCSSTYSTEEINSFKCEVKLLNHAEVTAMRLRSLEVHHPSINQNIRNEHSIIFLKGFDIYA